MNENHDKKWLFSISNEQKNKNNENNEEKYQNKCELCEKNNYIIEELRNQLNEEKKAMDETILLVDKMENDHKKEINELKLLLNFEKDKVVMLEKSLDTERKARMEEIYKQDRQTKDFDYVSKDYEIISNLNRDMVLEFEALKNENSALGISVKSLQDNKQTLLNELKKYEEQVAELENQNTNLRKRLYETESQRDTFQIQIDKLKDKVSSLSVETLTRPGSFKKRGQSHSLTPLHGTHSLVSYFKYFLFIYF